MRHEARVDATDQVQAQGPLVVEGDAVLTLRARTVLRVGDRRVSSRREARNTPEASKAS